MERLHARTSPALLLEERVAWHTVAGDTASVERELNRALAALEDGSRPGLARWARGAAARLPETARRTTAGWLLSQAARGSGPRRLQRLDELPDGLHRIALGGLLATAGSARLGVLREADIVRLGEVEGPGAVAIQVPDTDPRLLTLEVSARAGPVAVDVALPVGEVVEHTVGRGPLGIRTGTGHVYELPEVPAEERPRVFISYAHEDERWRQSIEAALRPLEEGLRFTWSDRSIAAGDDWAREIESALQQATVAVLLISPDYLASTYIMRQEVPALLERSDQGGPLLVPVLVRPCAWQEISWLRDRQVLSADGMPLSALEADRVEDALARIATTIARLARATERRPETADEAPREAPEVSRFEGDSEEAPQSADLNVTIVGHDKEFLCRVSSPYLDKVEEERWNLRWSVGEFVKRFVDTATDPSNSPTQVKASLIGAGIELFRATPEAFRKTFWQLVDNGHPPRAIQIITEEPHFLWELMVPNRVGPEGKEEIRGALGTEFALARWFTEPIKSPKQDVAIVDCFVIAPSYDHRQRLKYAEDEAEMIRHLFGGERIQPATFDNIRDKLGAGSYALLHFAGRGEGESVELDNGESLTSVHIAGDDVLRRFFSSNRPLVFLNAGGAGRQHVTLTGLGAFAARLASFGASAVVAPAWNVKDNVAHSVAVHFYEAISRHPEKPIAAIVQEIRGLAYERGEDSYAAYNFFGSAVARVTVGRRE